MIESGKCTDCRDRLPTGQWYGCCPTCKELGRLLNELHKVGSCPADRTAKPERVERYAAIVAAGGRIFE